MFHKIKSAAPLPGLRLLVHFADGCTKIYDVSAALSRAPALSALRDAPGLFEQVSVDPGGCGVSWNDDLDLDGAELWANGMPAASPFDGLLSFGEATDLWGLSESTLRKAVAYRRLTDGLDVQKFGKQWLITRAAMEREYGPQPK